MCKLRSGSSLSLKYEAMCRGHNPEKKSVQDILKRMVEILKIYWVNIVKNGKNIVKIL